MAPWQVLGLIACGIIGIWLGIWKSQWWRGMLAGLFLGPLGLLIMLLIPVSTETRIERQHKRYEIEAEAARRAGHPYPPQQ